MYGAQVAVTPAARNFVINAVLRLRLSGTGQSMATGAQASRNAMIRMTVRWLSSSRSEKNRATSQRLRLMTWVPPNDRARTKSTAWSGDGWNRKLLSHSTNACTGHLRLSDHHAVEEPPENIRLVLLPALGQVDVERALQRVERAKQDDFALVAPDGEERLEGFDRRRPAVAIDLQVGVVAAHPVKRVEAALQPFGCPARPEVDTRVHQFGRDVRREDRDGLEAGIDDVHLVIDGTRLGLRERGHLAGRDLSASVLRERALSNAVLGRAARIAGVVRVLVAFDKEDAV